MNWTVLIYYSFCILLMIYHPGMIKRSAATLVRNTGNRRSRTSQRSSARSEQTSQSANGQTGNTNRPSATRTRQSQPGRRAQAASAAAMTTQSVTAATEQNSTVEPARVGGSSAANSGSAGEAFVAAALARLQIERPDVTHSAQGTPATVTSVATADQLLCRLPPPLIPLPVAVSNDLVILNDDFPPSKPAASSSTNVRSSVRSKDNAECAICLEKEPDSALYPCGHMCMCYECAVSVQKQRSALCPMCRQPIVDILKIYRN